MLLPAPNSTAPASNAVPITTATPSVIPTPITITPDPIPAPAPNALEGANTAAVAAATADAATDSKKDDPEQSDSPGVRDQQWLEFINRILSAYEDENIRLRDEVHDLKSQLANYRKAETEMFKKKLNECMEMVDYVNR